MYVNMCVRREGKGSNSKKNTQRERDRMKKRRVSKHEYIKRQHIYLTSSVVEFKANSDYLQIQPVQYEAHTTVERKVVYVVHKFYASANYPLEYRSNFSYIPSSSSSIHPSK